MKKFKILLCSYYVFFFTIQSFVHYPCTLIIENKTNEILSVCLEYRLDQLYKNSDATKAPLVPNNKRYHYLHNIAPGSKAVVPVLALSPCSPEFCFLDTDLKGSGFTPFKKRIEGAITIQNKNISYTFLQTLFEGQTVIFQVNHKDLTTLFT